jgi:PAS domain S-box-containing protein
MPQDATGATLEMVSSRKAWQTEIERLRTRAERAEAELADLRERASSPLRVMQNVRATVYQRILYPDGSTVYTYSSGGLHAQLGISHDDLLVDSSLLFNRIHPEDRDRFQDAIRTSARTLEPMDIEQRYVTPTGEIMWCRTVATPTARAAGAVVFDGVAVDVTDKKRAEAALRDSEERFRAITEVSFDAVCVIEEGIITAVNGRATELLGFDKSELIGRPALTLIPPADRDEVLRRAEAGLGGVYETTIFNRDERAVPIEVSATRLRLGGRGVRVVALRDQTESKRAEAELRDSEERYRRLVELLPSGIFVSDGKKFLFANHAAAKIFGADDPAKLVGASLDDLVHPDEYGSAAARIREVLRGASQVPFAERRCLKFDGSEFVADTAGTQITWRGRPAVLSVVHDATERRRSEAALRESEERYRKLVELCPLAILVLDGNSILFANDAAASMFGAKAASDLVGTRAPLLVHPDERQLARERNRQVLEEGAKMPFTERRRIRLDGTEVVTESAIAAITWGGRRAILGVIRDATERRQAEMERREAAAIQERQLAELKCAKERLEQQSADLKRTAADLEFLRAEAERANAAKSKFLATASHEMRQPLQALNLLTYSLAATARDRETLALAEDMKRALSATERLLSALLDINRLEAGVLTPEIENFPLSTLFDRLSIEFTGPAREKNLDLRVVRSRATVRSDFELLASIVRNFLSNAIKYTRTGTILLGARRRGKSTVIEVWDTGIGIPSDQHRKIFEEFFQLESGGRHNEGLGLGLTIVERTAKLLSHDVDVRSVVGRGSVFSVAVPNAHIPFRGRRPKSQPARDLPADVSVLVIDDHRDVLAAMERLLREWGLNVDATDDAETALARLQAAGPIPDLVVVDHRLTGKLSGIAVLDEIRRVVGRSVPSLIITGDTSAAQVRAIEAAGYPYFHKPIDPDRLRLLLPALLDSSRR